MVHVNFNAYKSYVTDILHQWDINQELVIKGLEVSVAPEIHFANANMDRAIVRQSSLSRGVITAPIPNSLLQTALTIKAYVGIYDENTFKVVETIEIPVIAKPKPTDYVINADDEEIYSFRKLEYDLLNIDAKFSEKIDECVLLDQGSAHIGKVLVVGADGKLTVATMSNATADYDIVGVVDDNNVITLTGDLADGEYTFRYFNANQYSKIGTLFKGELPEEDTTVYPPTGELFVASTCEINSRITSSGEISTQNSTFVTDFILIGDLAVGETRDILFSGFQIQMERPNPYTKIEVYDAYQNRLGQATGPTYNAPIEYDTSGRKTYKATIDNPSKTATARYIRIVGHLGEEYATLGSKEIYSNNDLNGCSIIIG